jgi:hypothetical protein
MDYPRDAAVPTHIHSFMRFCNILAAKNIGNIGVPASGAWGTANTAIYIPVRIPWPYVVRRMFWVNGSAAGGNCDIGLYSIGGGKIYTAGSTAGSGNTAPQYVTPGTEILLSPGVYFIAFAADNTTANRLTLSALTAASGRPVGYYQQASAFALPSPASFAAYNAVGIPLVGITNSSSGF